MIDGLVALTLLYLFYYQGSRLLGSAKKNNKYLSSKESEDIDSRYNYSTQSIERLLKSKIPVKSLPIDTSRDTSKSKDHPSSKSHRPVSTSSINAESEIDSVFGSAY